MTSKQKETPAMKNNVLIYHLHCSDGLASMAAMGMVFRTLPNITILGLDYPARDELMEYLLNGDLDLSQTNIALVDFSLTTDMYRLLLIAGATISTVDHHVDFVNQTKTQEYADLQETYGKRLHTYAHDNEHGSGVQHVLSMLTSNSTEALAFYGEESLQAWKWVSDRDTWKWKVDGSKAYHELYFPRLLGIELQQTELLKGSTAVFVAKEPKTFIEAALAHFQEPIDLSIMKESGLLISAAKRTDLQNHILTSGRFVKNDNDPSMEIVMVPSLRMVDSETGDVATDEGVGVQVAMMYHFSITENKWRMSFRSRRYSVLQFVREFCKQNPEFSGGGHEKAAGMSCELTDSFFLEKLALAMRRHQWQLL